MPETPRQKAHQHRKQRRKVHWGKRIVGLVCTVGFVVIAASLGVGIWVESSLRRIAVLGDYDGRPTPAYGTNWLLVGSDSREDLSPEQQAQLSTGGDLGSGRTDTILLLHIPGLLSGTSPTLVSIPRDSYVDIPGYGTDKINAAFAAGGPALLAQTVEEATGLHLDHYAEVGFAGFGGVVDALGGVRICPAEPIDDPLAGIDLPAGCQIADGPAALGYVRSRAGPRADLDRMVHQREFMSSMVDRATSPVTWLNPWRWYAVPRAAIGALGVDDETHVWDLARLGWALHRSGNTLTVPIGEFAGNESGSVLLWNAEAAAALFEALRTDSAIPQQVFDGQP